MTIEAFGHAAGRRILIVEDIPDAAESQAKLLQILGHEVRVARDGPQAVATVASWSPEYVLLDLGLPGMDGYELARRFRQEAACRDSVLIAVTGYGRQEDRQKSQAAGIDYHLLKPVEPKMLLSLLSRHAPAAGGMSGGFDSSAELLVAAASLSGD